MVIRKTPIPQTRSHGSILLVSSERERERERDPGNEDAVSQLDRQMGRAALSRQRRQKLRNYFASCRGCPLRPLDSRSRTTTSTRFVLSFFSRILKNRNPGNLHCTSFHLKSVYCYLKPSPFRKMIKRI